MPKKQVKKYRRPADIGVTPSISLKAASIFELAHPARQTIMDLAAASPKRHTDFVKSLKIAPAEVSRHLHRLAVSGLIWKNSESAHEATQYGNIICQELKCLDFVCKNKDFFGKHDLSVIPKELSSWQALTDAEVVKGGMQVMEMLYKVTARADERIWGMAQIAIDPLIMEHAHQLERGLELRLILPERARTPYEYIERRMMSLDIRTSSGSRVCISMNEREGAIILPDAKNEMDYSIALYGTGETFMRWLSLMFSHYWEKGTDVVL